MFHLCACLGTNLLGDTALENGPSIRAAIGLVPSVPIGFDADQLHIRRNLPIEPALMVRHPHGILPRSVLRGGAGEVLDLLENETGMHSCLVSNPNSPVGAGGKRRHPRGFESTGIGADKPEAR